MQDDDRSNDRSARWMLIVVAIVILVVAAGLAFVTADRWRTSPPGGDLAPIPAAGGQAPAANAM